MNFSTDLRRAGDAEERELAPTLDFDSVVMALLAIAPFAVFFSDWPTAVKIALASPSIAWWVVIGGMLTLSILARTVSWCLEILAKLWVLGQWVEL